ncbi:hypothetical protein GCM10009577_34660 [Streptomyces javensis]
MRPAPAEWSRPGRARVAGPAPWVIVSRRGPGRGRVRMAVVHGGHPGMDAGMVHHRKGAAYREDTA